MLIGRQGNGVDRAGEATQMTDLAVLRISDIGLAGLRIDTQNIWRTGIDAVFASNASMNFQYRHSYSYWLEVLGRVTASADYSSETHLHPEEYVGIAFDSRWSCQVPMAQGACSGSCSHPGLA
jgi:hypothetical protein